jgi:hypothetical protein
MVSGSMTAFLLSLLAVAVIHFGVPLYSKTYGYAVQKRFLETGEGVIPTFEGMPGTPLSANALRDWVERHPVSARGYAFPVLIPFDLLYMAAICCVFGFGSVLLASLVPYASVVPTVAWWTLPLLFLVADFSEDISLVRLLSSADAVTTEAFDRARFITELKLKALVVLPAQAALLAVAAGIAWLTAK